MCVGSTFVFFWEGFEGLKEEAVEESTVLWCVLTMALEKVLQ